MTTVKTAVDMGKALAWIDEHWTGQKACPICQGDRWGLSEMVGEVRELSLAPQLSGQAAWPLVILTCQTCGYALLFSAVVIGLLKGGAAQ